MKTMLFSSSRFTLKTDDDVFINVPNVLDLVTSPAVAVHSDVIVGHVMHGAQPIRERGSRYYTPPALYRHAHFPPYASGGSLVLDLIISSFLLVHILLVLFFSIFCRF